MLLCLLSLAHEKALLCCAFRVDESVNGMLSQHSLDFGFYFLFIRMLILSIKEDPGILLLSRKYTLQGDIKPLR